jgi:predicted permease
MTLLQDVRFASRVLMKNRAFTLVAMVSLAIGIGANSAIFSLADALLLRPLPVMRPSEVVTIESKTPKNPFASISYPDYVDYRDRSRSFTGIVAYQLTPLGFAEDAGALPHVKWGAVVSGNLFQVMGVQPALGRAFRPDEDQVTGRDAVVILGYDFWKQQFGGDRSVLGRKVRLNGIDFTVIGVAPEHFTSLDQYFDLTMFVPIHMAPKLAAAGKGDILEKRDSRDFQVKGRLKPGVTMAQAQAELQSIAQGLQQKYPDTNHEENVAVRTELQLRVEQSPPDTTLLEMLFVMSGLVLLVACANVANLLLSRSRARSREMAVRLAVGAGRLRLIRQLLTESLLIGIGGGILGIGVAYAGAVFLSAIQVPGDLPIVFRVNLDERALLVAMAACVASVVLFGLVPALQTSRTDLVPSLKALDADASGKRRIWGRNLLVIGQVAASVLLLILTTMMYRGFAKELKGGPGYRVDHLLTLSFDPSLMRYTDAQTQQFYKRVLDRTAELPSVNAVALTTGIPMSPGGVQQKSLIPEGYVLPKGQKNVTVFSSTVGGRFFEAMDIPILRGRAFRASDTDSSPKVAIVNDAMARKFWPNKDAVGQRFRLNDAKGPWVQIVGVVRTSKYVFISEPPLECVYMPLAQDPQARMTLLAYTPGDPRALATPIRETIRGIEANMPVFGVRTMRDFYDARAVSTTNFIVQTVGGLGTMGLVLAMVGLYGLVAYSVSRRVREFGIRMAIGAQSAQVLRMVLKQGLTLAITGIVIGLLVSLGAGRVLTSVFGSTSADLTTYIFVPITLLFVTMLSALGPALRAAKIDPIKALRYE